MNYSNLEALGNSDSYAAERQQISDSGLFNYSLVSETADEFAQFDSTYQVGTRAWGALQVGGAFALAGIGAATSEIGVGIPLTFVAADEGAAGLGTMISGTQVPTFGAQFLADQTGLTISQAEMLYSLGSMAASAGAANSLSQMGTELEVDATSTATSGKNVNSTSAGTDNEAGFSELPAVSSGAEEEAAAGAKGISITIEPKIADQMGKRGWTESSIQSAIDNPVKTVVTKDTRFDTVSGSRLNDPATGYVSADGSYVVRNDRTGAIVQVSNKNDPKWVAPWD